MSSLVGFFLPVALTRLEPNRVGRAGEGTHAAHPVPPARRPLLGPRTPRRMSLRPWPWLSAARIHTAVRSSPLTAFSLGPCVCTLKAGSTRHTKSTHSGHGVPTRGDAVLSLHGLPPLRALAQGCEGAGARGKAARTRGKPVMSPVSFVPSALKGAKGGRRNRPATSLGPVLRGHTARGVGAQAGLSATPSGRHCCPRRVPRALLTPVALSPEATAEDHSWCNSLGRLLGLCSPRDGATGSLGRGSERGRHGSSAPGQV